VCILRLPCPGDAAFGRIGTILLGALIVGIIVIDWPASRDTLVQTGTGFYVTALAGVIIAGVGLTAPGRGR
jgi:phosphatidylserine decarboxylase